MDSPGSSDLHFCRDLVMLHHFSALRASSLGNYLLFISLLTELYDFLAFSCPTSLYILYVVPQLER